MECLYPRCAGLDVHKDTVVACARTQSSSQAKHEVETFGTTTTELLRLSDWLAERECTHVAMEATGVYWKPVWHVLEPSFTLILGNASHIRNVPGRKTDVNDATWIADLLAHGLIRASFVPPTPVQELRALTRTRKQLVREKGQHVLRIQKTLEDANLKIGSVASDIMGLSGRLIIDALVRGVTSPEALAHLAAGRLRAPRKEIVESLRGCVTKHHRFLLKLHFDQVKAIEAAIAAVEREVGEVLEPFRAAAELLVTMPGVSDIVAHVILSEIGVDMARFPSAGHLISWAGMCPRNDESAGKRRSTRVRKGAPWLKTTLVQAAWAAVRSKGTYLRAQFLRLKSRRGPKKAIMAVAASMLTAAYYMLRDHVPYHDLGPDYFDRADESAKIRRLTRKIQELGYEVEVRKSA
jgi:transposase